MVELQAEEAEATVKAPTRDEEVITAHQIPDPDSEVMAVLSDGAMISIREESWKEVNIATISAVETEVQMERHAVNRLAKLLGPWSVTSSTTGGVCTTKDIVRQATQLVAAQWSAPVRLWSRNV